MGFGDPGVGVTPDGGSVLADREVERRVGIGDVLGRRLDQGEVDAVVSGESAGGAELFGRDVHSHHSGAAASHPRRHVARAASQLDRVPVGHVIGKETELTLRHAPDPPAGLGPCPMALAGGDPVAGPFVPVRPVRQYVLGEFFHASDDAPGVLEQRTIFDDPLGPEA